MSIKQFICGLFVTTTVVTTTYYVTKTVTEKKYSEVETENSTPKKEETVKTDISKKAKKIADRIKDYALQKAIKILGWVSKNQIALEAVGTCLTLIGGMLEILYRIKKFKSVNEIGKNVNKILKDGNAFQQGYFEGIVSMMHEIKAKSLNGDTIKFLDDNNKRIEFIVKEVAA